MTQRIFDVRIRPARLAILIDKDATIDDLLLAFEFCSRIWGGRFAQILPVSGALGDSLTGYRLTQLRPDYVYGIAVDDSVWGSYVTAACQPRGYGHLEPRFVRSLFGPHNENYILIDDALLDLFRNRDPRPGHCRRLTIVDAKGTEWAAHVAALFGLHYEKLKPEYSDERHALAAGCPRHSFAELVTHFATEGLQSWLDVTGHNLSVDSMWGEQLAPRIVLVDSKIEDLSLFWNLRGATDCDRPAAIMPLPMADANDDAVLPYLRDWVLALAQYGVRSNFCLVTSQSVSEADCCQFAARLECALADSPTPFVDYEAPRKRLPTVIPYDCTAILPVEVKGRKITFQPPSPRSLERLGSSRTWFIDLVTDRLTGRAVNELVIPGRKASFEVLNCPCPPTISLSRVPRIGYGVDSINLSCSRKESLVRLCLPTAAEIITEILRDGGLVQVPDEKRSAYLPAIRRFGGIDLAARAFCSPSREILASLYGGTKTIDKIMGDCRLGNGKLPDDGYLQRVMSFLEREPERTKRISAQRFADFTRGRRAQGVQLNDLLDIWANSSIVVREWKLGPCTRCGRTYFESQLNIRRPILCPGCGNRITLPPRVEVGYRLHRAVEMAILEGIIPVVLTGRFLKRMTDRGFFWLPGMKYREGASTGDIDVVACCDGRLVFCECKNLLGSAPDPLNWDQIVHQFTSLARVAIKCEADLVVLASLVDQYPETVKADIESALGDSIAYLLLEKQDLESGARRVQHDDFWRTLKFYDLIAERVRDEPPKRLTNPSEPRQVEFGFGTVKYG